MKFRKYVENLVGTVGELTADDVTYVFAVRPGAEPKSPAKLIKVDEDFVIVEVKFRRSKVHRVIPIGGLFALHLRGIKKRAGGSPAHPGDPRHVMRV